MIDEGFFFLNFQFANRFAFYAHFVANERVDSKKKYAPPERSLIEARLRLFSERAGRVDCTGDLEELGKVDVIARLLKYFDQKMNNID